LRRFEGLPHRMRKLDEIAGVAWYDDSKGTNVGAAVAALSGIDRPAVLIAGGDGKGQDFAPLAPAVAAHARAVLLIGRDAPLIERALAATGVALERCASLEDAVARAAALACEGDAVLLSPACASFDMFRDYRHRGEAFAAAVAGLED
ncbi:MAG: glutamate ligase domain-containing protein, partial [Burkholderiales bacterium]